MSLWLDKYRPKNLDKLTINDDLTRRLHAIADSPQFPHLLFYGPAVRTQHNPARHTHHHRAPTA